MGTQCSFFFQAEDGIRDWSVTGVQTCALPIYQWTNYVFSYDFKEIHSYDCFVEMQIKNLDLDGTGKWLQFSTKYVPGPDGWHSVRASLDQFISPGLAGTFEPDKVHEIVVNIRMVT